MRMAAQKRPGSFVNQRQRDGESEEAGEGGDMRKMDCGKYQGTDQQTPTILPV